MESGNRLVVEYDMEIRASRSKVFPLLCPVREYDWIPEWKCEVIYSQSGFAEKSCVFATEFDDGLGRESWLICEYDPPSQISFVRAGKHRIMRYDILLKEHKRNSTLTWRQEIITLTSKGRGHLADYEHIHFPLQMQHIAKLLNKYVVDS